MHYKHILLWQPNQDVRIDNQHRISFIWEIYENDPSGLDMKILFLFRKVMYFFFKFACSASIRPTLICMKRLQKSTTKNNTNYNDHTGKEHNIYVEHEQAVEA